LSTFFGQIIGGQQSSPPYKIKLTGKIMTWKISDQEKFQLVQLGALFACVSLVLHLILDRSDLLLIYIALALLIVSVLFYRLLIPVKIIWFGLSERLSRITGFIILSAVFFLVLTPMAIARSIFGGKGMDIDLKSSDESHFIKRTSGVFTAEDLKKQF
jgi:hypothetical protein